MGGVSGLFTWRRPPGLGPALPRRLSVTFTHFRRFLSRRRKMEEISTQKRGVGIIRNIINYCARKLASRGNVRKKGPARLLNRPPIGASSTDSAWPPPIRTVAAPDTHCGRRTILRLWPTRLLNSRKKHSAAYVWHEAAARPSRPGPLRRRTSETAYLNHFQLHDEIAQGTYGGPDSAAAPSRKERMAASREVQQGRLRPGPHVHMSDESVL